MAEGSTLCANSDDVDCKRVDINIMISYKAVQRIILSRQCFKAMFSLLVCWGLLLADSFTDVLEGAALSSQSLLFFSDGEVEFSLELSCFLALCGQLLLQDLTLFLRG